MDLDQGLRKRGKEPNGHATITSEAAEIKATIKKTLTILWNDLDHWQRDNAFIHAHYRPSSNSLKASLHSLTYLHNETVNIYTHLLGSLFFLLFSIYFYTTYLPTHQYTHITLTDKLAFAAFWVGVVACLGCSASYHCISNHSHDVARIGNKIDYLGIVLLIWGSFVPSIYLGFSERFGLVEAYLGMISVIAVGCCVVSVKDRFRTPEWRQFRAGMFLAMGLSAVMPMVHGVLLFGIGGMDERIGLGWVVLQGVLYVAGAALYAVSTFISSSVRG